MKTRLPVWLLLAAGLTASAQTSERNVWPFWVGQEEPASGQVASSQTLGPLFFQRQLPAGGRQEGLRPLYLHTVLADRETSHLLYPFFTWERRGGDTNFSFFQLVNDRRRADDSGRAVRGFDVWPFYFSRDTGDPATSYRALLPFGGEIKNRFGKDRLTWTLFPLYFHTEKGAQHTTTWLWPIVRSVGGDGHYGFEVWPLAGERGREGDYQRQFFLWPLVYNHRSRLGDPVPEEKTGFLPFYARATGPGQRSETFLWPFFGYIDRTQPTRYHETHYLWPFLVQGRGEHKTVNRFAPFYTHSVVKGYDKTWVLWPLWRQARWDADGVAQEKTQLLFFLYWSLEQRSLANPAAAPAAKRHLWPLYSAWDNGAGRRQVQLLSPFEVFFPNNDPVRQLYSPLFALYRFDQRAPGDTRWSLLWGAATSRRTATEREFHLGPLYGSRSTPAEQRITLGAGLLSWRRPAGAARWTFSFFDFPSASASPGPATTASP